MLFANVSRAAGDHIESKEALEEKGLVADGWLWRRSSVSVPDSSRVVVFCRYINKC